MGMMGQRVRGPRLYDNRKTTGNRRRETEMKTNKNPWNDEGIGKKKRMTKIESQI